MVSKDFDYDEVEGKLLFTRFYISLYLSGLLFSPTLQANVVICCVSSTADICDMFANS